MQLFMRSIAFSANEDDVKLALAERLHRPPFSTGKPINFRVDLFRERGSRTDKHRGMGLLTVANADIGEMFLSLYASGVNIKGRIVIFTRSREDNQATIEAVRNAPWIDPKTVQEEKRKRAELSGPVTLASFSFGRFCRDGVFSAEATYRGTVACNLEARRIEITHEGSGTISDGGAHPTPTRKSSTLKDSPYASSPRSVSSDRSSLISSSPTSSIFSDIFSTPSHSPTSPVFSKPSSSRSPQSSAFDFRSMIKDLLGPGGLGYQPISFSTTTTRSVHYPGNRIVDVVVSDRLAQVFLHSDLPPTFEHRIESNILFTDQEPMAERASSFGEDDFRVSSLASQGLCLDFASSRDMDTFLARCRRLHLPRPTSCEVRVEQRNIYSKANLENLRDFLRSIDNFDLAFEVDKAVWGGVLEPQEAVSMRDSLVALQQRTDANASETAAIFRYFASTLRVPGPLPAARPKPKRRRRGKKRQLVDSPVASMRQMLAQAIEAYIAELYRLNNSFTPSAGVYQSYHLILTPSTQILDGPLPDQSNSVLRRFKNNDRFLRVSFQDENRSPPRRDQGLRVSIDELLEKRYKKALNRGVEVAGRSYRFLGYSMSGLKEYSFIFVTPFDFNGVLLDAERIRDSLGDFRKISYQPAMLGARWSQAFSASAPSVTLRPDQIQQTNDKVSETGSQYTDGCSSMSTALGRQVWKSLRASQKIPRAPSAFQFRCGGAKGVLVQNPDLYGETLYFRPSQTKFEAENVRTLDIAATSARPILTYLNRPLIALLEHHGTPKDAFIRLQDSAIHEVQRMKDSLLQASRIYSQHGLGASFRLPSLFNNLHYQLKLEIGAWSNPSIFHHQLIKTALAFATMHILREIKHRGHILVPGSYTLMGVSDEWDCLEEGEIYARVVDARAGIDKQITGRILITRSPQVHPGDAQFVQAVRKPQLAHLTNVVVFSCKGSRSLPSQLGGGDLDGDIYNLIIEETLYPPKDFTAVPGEYVAIPPKKTELPCTVSDVVDFVIDYIKSDLVGIISVLHLRISDLKGFDCDECLTLAEKASHAVDFQKRGVPVNLKDLPKPPDKLKPDYLSGEGINPADSMGDRFYLSKKVLGELYRRVPVEDYRPDPSELEQQYTDGQRIRRALASVGLRRLGLPSLNDPPNEDLLEEMRYILDEYSEQLLVIAQTHTISKRSNASLSEAELVSGTIQERYHDHRKRREALAAMNLQTGELARAIRYEFQSPQFRRSAENPDEDEDEDEDEEEWDDWEETAGDEERRRDRFERALAAWVVAEEALNEDRSSFGPSSFGLLALGTMLDVIKEAKNSI